MVPEAGFQRTRLRRPGVLVLTATALVLTGCAALVGRTTGRLSANLAAAMSSHDDPATIRDAAPAYMVLADSLVRETPESPAVLAGAADLYASYSGAFVDDPDRSLRLSARARDYGLRALCAADRRACDVASAPYDEFERVIASLGGDELDVLYTAAAAWATWIQARSDDWKAVADKARVEAMIRRVLELDATYGQGAPYLYLGVLDTLIPQALGGKPERGRAAFEEAISRSQGRNLMAKVLLAERYARVAFDRALHDRLAREVLAAEVEAGEMTLANALAREQAARLLATSEDWFGE